jgi:FAD dependent oxidoreductase TIGR03364
MTVDPRLVIGALPEYLTRRFGVRFFYNTAVREVGATFVAAAGQRCEAGTIIVAGGDDFQTLFPECFADSEVTRCKLQMMRTARQPDGWELGPSLAFGLTLTHYPTFRACPGLSALKSRITRETPDLEKWGIHVMVSQTSDGRLTIGDSHEYGLSVDVFDKPFVNALILDYAKQYLRVPRLEITEQWHGVYARHAEKPFLHLNPLPGVHVVTVTNGLGMTMSFGLADRILREAGVLW